MESEMSQPNLETMKSGDRHTNNCGLNCTTDALEGSKGHVISLSDVALMIAIQFGWLRRFK